MIHYIKVQRLDTIFGKGIDIFSISGNHQLSYVSDDAPLEYIYQEEL